MVHSVYRLTLLHNLKRLLSASSVPKWLKVHLHHSQFPLLETLHFNQPQVNKAVVFEAKLEAEASSFCCDVLVGKGSSCVAVPAVILGVLSGTNMTGKVVALRVVVGEHFGQPLVLLNDLQEQTAIWLEGRVAVQQQPCDHEIQTAVAVGLQDKRIGGLIAVVVEGAALLRFSNAVKGAIIGCVGRVSGVSGWIEEALNTVVDFAESLVAAPELEGLAVDLEEVVLVDDVAVVHLVSVICLGEEVLHH